LRIKESRTNESRTNEYMRYILTILLITTLANLNAQAPDFTLTDIDSDPHHLYDYLNDGKTVVLNFSTTECGECWNFHQTQNMNTANALYGESGADEMVFLFLEIDSTSDLSDLEGEGLYTEGNWIEGTTFPIIDNAQDIAADYGITTVPTVIAVCAADTTTTDLYTAGYPTPLDMYIVHNICTPATAANDLTIVSVETDIFCGTLDPEILLVNTGTAPIDTATFVISTGTDIETIGWNGSVIAPNEQTTLPLTTGLTEATSIEVTVLDVNQTPNGSSFTKEVMQAEVYCIEELVITIVTDDFGCETAWDIRGPSGALIGGNVDATAGNRAIEYDAQTGACTAAGYANNTTYTLTFPGPDGEGNVRMITTGCYEFNIVDDWGDGMCCDYGDGSYTIADQDGNVLATGSDFGAEETVKLDLRLAVSGGNVVSSGVDTLCKDTTYVLQTNNPIFDTISSLEYIAWGTWILSDPLDQTAIPTGGLPNDEIPDDDPNYADFWLDANGEVVLGDSVQISADSSGITYYFAPIVTTIGTEFNPPCTGLNPSEGYTILMNPLDNCEPFVVGVEQPIEKKSITVFPNPAQDDFNISFDLNETSDVSVSLYNMIGKQVKSLQNTRYSVGQNNIQMDTRDLPSGLYFVTLHTEAGDFSKRITIAKP